MEGQALTAPRPSREAAITMEHASGYTPPWRLGDRPGYTTSGRAPDFYCRATPFFIVLRPSCGDLRGHPGESRAQG